MQNLGGGAMEPRTKDICIFQKWLHICHFGQFSNTHGEKSDEEETIFVTVEFGLNVRIRSI